ncbi:MinD/ParA family protein [Thermodesulfatator atlanticus]|uniref:MinD/ParA family protein n=1 Tax=Thermodesulfatator atlanticus TaxID=501497 RepID=UPI0003B50A24|nr:MinD/ParA family protein [Thermodesulfatator atlanticus]
MMISITSGKGGVGKTSLAINLSLALSPEYRVLLVDADLGLANVDVMLSLAPDVTVRHVLLEGRPIKEAVVQGEYGFHILPAASGVVELAQPDSEMRGILELGLNQLALNYDLLLFDTGAGISPAVLWFNCLAKYTIVVFTPEPTSITDAYALMKVLHRDYGQKNFWLLANQADAKEGAQYFSHLNRVIDRYLGINPVYLGAIPKDPALARSIRMQKPLLAHDRNTKAARAILAVAERIKKLLEEDKKINTH